MNKMITKQYVAAANYRYVEEVMKDLGALSEQVEDAMQLLKITQKHLLNAALFTVNQSDIKNGPAIKPDNVVKLKPSELKNLQDNYAVTRQLYDTLQTLDTMHSKMLQSFPRDSKEATRAASEIERMRKSVTDKLNTAFAFLRDLAKANAPQQFTRFVAAMCQVLERSVQYSSSETWLYLFETGGELVFTEYVQLKDLVSETGEEFGDLFIAISYKNTEEGPQFYLATMTAFEPPSEDLLRKRVTDLKSAVRGLNMLLDLDGFANSVGSLPLDLLIKPGAINKSLFKYQSKIKTFEVTPDGVMLFTLKPVVKSQEDANEITRQLYLDVNGLIKTHKFTKLRMTTGKDEEGCRVVKFGMVRVDGAPAATEEDVDFLKARFNLSKQNLAQIVKILNTGASN